MQTRRASLIEANLSTAIGFVISMLTQQFVIAPLFDLKTSVVANLGITLIFTAISVARGYYVRRLFNFLHLRGHLK